MKAEGLVIRVMLKNKFTRSIDSYYISVLQQSRLLFILSSYR